MWVGGAGYLPKGLFFLTVAFGASGGGDVPSIFHHSLRFILHLCLGCYFWSQWCLPVVIQELCCREICHYTADVGIFYGWGWWLFFLGKCSRNFDGNLFIFRWMMLALSVVLLVTPLPIGGLNSAPSWIIEPTIFWWRLLVMFSAFCFLLATQLCSVFQKNFKILLNGSCSSWLFTDRKILLKVALLTFSFSWFTMALRSVGVILLSYVET